VCCPSDVNAVSNIAIPYLDKAMPVPPAKVGLTPIPGEPPPEVIPANATTSPTSVSPDWENALGNAQNQIVTVRNLAALHTDLLFDIEPHFLEHLC
jgi:hypothetical protein